MLLIAVTLNLTVIGHADDATEWNQIMIDALHVGGLPAGGPIRVAPSSLIRHHTQRRRAPTLGVSGRSTGGRRPRASMSSCLAKGHLFAGAYRTQLVLAKGLVPFLFTVKSPLFTCAVLPLRDQMMADKPREAVDPAFSNSVAQV
jgi:hypothetical protein